MKERKAGMSYFLETKRKENDLNEDWLIFWNRVDEYIQGTEVVGLIINERTVSGS